jgi:hypothetical protein
MPVLDLDAVAVAIDTPLQAWHHQCHAISLAIVKSDVLPDLGWPVRRVARGTARGVMGQHSWIALGDPYDPTTPVVDPTLWTYVPTVQGIYVGPWHHHRHTPHGGHETIWAYGRPPEATGRVLQLDPDAEAKLSRVARSFLELCGPLDWDGWSFLANAPVSGWPAAEIIAAMDSSRNLSAIVPIDRLGMLTDRNPGGLYLPDRST